MTQAEGSRDGGAQPACETDSGTRPQKGGEAATTRFGIEDGDNTDTPATGDGQRED